MAKSKPTVTVNKSAKTGQFVSAPFAAAHKSTTYTTKVTKGK